MLALGLNEGRVHGGDRARPGSSPSIEGQTEGRPRARHDAYPHHAPHRPPAGDARDRAADRQRDDRDAQDDIAGQRNRGDRSCSTRREIIYSQRNVLRRSSSSSWRASGTSSSRRFSRSGNTTSSAITGAASRFRQSDGALRRHVVEQRRRRPPSSADDCNGESRGGRTRASGRLEVLKGVSLDVAPGEVTCILRPSGSGKTTFIRCINHLEKIDGGPSLGQRRARRLSPVRRQAPMSCGSGEVARASVRRSAWCSSASTSSVT